MGMIELHEECKSTTNITLGALSTEEYKVVETNTPPEYDYGYVIPCYECSNSQKIFRIVLIPVQQMDYQCGRYFSGGICVDVTGNERVVGQALDSLRSKLVTSDSL
jgi:hypothetical protein